MSEKPFNPFTWSMRRREMFERCPREYFYHYYGSAGGAFVNTGTLKAEKLHLLRNMTEVESYVRQLLFHHLRSLFNSGTTGVPEIFLALEEQFRRDLRNMVFGKPELDHKYPLLREVTLQGCSLRSLEEKVLKSLHSYKEVTGRALLPFLLQIPLEDRLFLPFPLRVDWNGLPCFVTPFAAWRDAGNFCAFCAGAPSEENCALLSFYALEKFRTPPEKVKIFHLGDEGIFQLEKVLSFSASFRRIRQDADRMLLLELKLKNGISGEKIFPQEHKTCGNCRFSSFCT